ncbi:hydrolase [Prauserella marina]|uniref:alpha/beta fold hydrolase n=1 Tax=Prauserella marina TaxID=530584 RepID=UPI000B8D8F48|nr:alpha/beta fold hydrolase [Prauserella marina]ASR34984.1 hydrolase [Prauserella marina]
MSRISFDDVTIGYDDLGAGEPVLLVHGHPFDRTMWRPQALHLAAAGYRVLTPDLRGYGESSVGQEVTPLSVFAADLIGLADRLGIDRFVLGGLSMGGQIVMETYRVAPHRIRALVLADTAPQAETEEGRTARDTMADRLVREGMDGYAREVLSKMIAPATIASAPEVAAHVSGMMRGTSPEGAAAALRGRARRPDYTELLTGIDVPTLVVVGGDDEFTPVSVAEFMHERIPGSVLSVIEDTAHLPNLERPAEFTGVLEAFLHTHIGR